jgi:5-formyltetrahydrofolate cyclo-ligase
MTTKNELRLLSLNTLTHLSVERREKASEKAYSALITQLQYIQGPIASFANKPLEINLWPLNQKLCQENRLLLPRKEGKNLVFYKVESLDYLQPCEFGIKQPDPYICKKANLEEIGLILVPGLCFDKNLHRIGYGKGYFDQFLSSCPPGIIKWGVGFIEQQIEKIPLESHDIGLDAVFLF